MPPDAVRVCDCPLHIVAVVGEIAAVGLVFTVTDLVAVAVGHPVADTV